MENGVNVEGHPLPSIPTTTGDFSPVTAGMFLSLAAKGANSVLSNEQMSPERAVLMEHHHTIDQLSTKSIKSPRK
eukprot:jgi/Psemu1/43223/gm1.43223_g